MQVIKRVLGYLNNYKKETIAAIFLLILSIVLNMLSPIITKHLIDDVIKGGERDILSVLLIAIISVEIGRAHV